MDKRGGGVSRFSVENFMSHSAENFRRGIVYCCIDFGYRKSLWIRGGGVSRFSVKKFLSHSAEKIHSWNLLRCVSENFRLRKSLWIRGEGGVSRFCVENFMSHSAENFRRGIVYCCIDFGYRKSLWIGGGGYQDFPSKIFCLTVPKNFIVGTFCAVFQKISGCEKVYG